MQYHRDGVRTGDPAIADAMPSKTEQQNVDVLIVGCGPAGLTLAAQLSAFPDITVKIIERKSGPLEVGQADGIACRSMEMFQAFGFAEKVAREAYWVNEVTFWRPDEANAGIKRVDRIQDVEDGLSQMPHVILSQARIHDFYLETMAKSASRLKPDYDCELVGLTRSQNEFPIEARLAVAGSGQKETIIRVKYVVGCDGARSAVRGFMGLELKGDSARQLWGVMDVLAVTDFPDIRLKCAIQSANDGSLLIIPREGGYLVRMYIELAELEDGERASHRKLTPQALVEKAQAILAPHTLDVKEVSWWSAYEIGQRVCDRFDDAADDHEPRIFIAGDACHTHSPKAGQGMNVSMADAFNLGWKLATVLRGDATPTLLSTYSQERRAKAQELIDFDRDMARLFSRKPTGAAEADQFQKYFQKHGRYTAGVETRYDASLITLDDSNQSLASGFIVGKRFHSAPVIRLADARRMELGHCMTADGRWRIVLFAPAEDEGLDALQAFSRHWTTSDDSPLRFQPEDADIDSRIDVRAVVQQSHETVDISRFPGLLLPRNGRYGLVDYEKAFCPDLKTGPDIFESRGIDRQQGAMIIVRPDQHVAGVLPLDGGSELTGFFSRFLTRAS